MEASSESKSTPVVHPLSKLINLDSQAVVLVAKDASNATKPALRAIDVERQAMIAKDTFETIDL